MSSLSKDLSDLGPLFQVVESQIVQAGVKQVVLAQSNPLRWSILISPPTNDGNYYYVSTQPGIVANGQGIGVAGAPGTGGAVWKNLDLNYRDSGPVVQQSWYGGGSSAPTNSVWTVIEVLLVPS